jgi:DNA-binding SARP family transcriptional activator
MIEFNVLGPLEFRRDGQLQSVPTVMLRRLLAVLLARAGSPVSIVAIIDALWNDKPPTTARHTLYAYVSRLRAVHGDDDRLEVLPGSYALIPRAGELDSVEFRRLVEDSARALDGGDVSTAGTGIGDALALWRGAAFEGLHDLPSIIDEATSLEQLRPTSFEQWADLEIAAPVP